MDLEKKKNRFSVSGQYSMVFCIKQGSCSKNITLVGLTDVCLVIGKYA